MSAQMMASILHFVLIFHSSPNKIKISLFIFCFSLHLVMSSSWLNVACHSPELEKVFFLQLNVAVDGQQRSTMQGFIKECYSLLTVTALKNSFWNHDIALGKLSEHIWFADKHWLLFWAFQKYTFFPLPFTTAYTGERSLFWLSSPLWFPLPAVCSLHDARSTIWQDSRQSLGGQCRTWVEINMASLSTGLHICLGAQRRIALAARHHDAFSISPTHPSHC